MLTFNFKCDFQLNIDDIKKNKSNELILNYFKYKLYDISFITLIRLGILSQIEYKPEYTNDKLFKSDDRKVIEVKN